MLELSAVLVTSVLLSSCGGEGLPEPTARPSVTATRPTVAVPTAFAGRRVADADPDRRTAGPHSHPRAPRSHDRADSNSGPILARIDKSDPSDRSDGHTVSRLPDTGAHHAAQFHGVIVD